MSFLERRAPFNPELTFTIYLLLKTLICNMLTGLLACRQLTQELIDNAKNDQTQPCACMAVYQLHLATTNYNVQFMFMVILMAVVELHCAERCF